MKTHDRLSPLESIPQRQETLLDEVQRIAGPILRIAALAVLALASLAAIAMALTSCVSAKTEATDPEADQTLAALTTPTSATVTFLFFDEQGNRLNGAAVLSRMTNGGGNDILSSGTFDLDTLKALTLNTSTLATDGTWKTPFTKLTTNLHQGLMVHWNTVDTGYSSFLLDNNGAGFAAPGTFIFNERLALDARRQFLAALAAKPTYMPSVDFAAQRTAIDRCFVQLDAAASQSNRGAVGQQCVNQLAVGMGMLMREYGSQVAAKMPDNHAYWGVTINPGSNGGIQTDYAKLQDLVALFAPQHRWVRMVMGGTGSDDYALLTNLASWAQTNQVQTMGQLFDSSAQASISLATFQKRVDKALAYPGIDKFTAWEVGNEVNGGWTGSQMPAKIAYASSHVKAKFPNKMVCLTFYWYSMQDTMKSSLFNWIGTNVTQAIKDNIDCVTLSIYIDQQPLGFSWDLVMTKLASLFPGKKVMVGEMGFINDPTVTTFYKEGPASWTEEQGAEAYIHSRYPSAFATPNAVGGGFWWYYDDEMVGQTARWHALRDTYCGIYPALCPITK